MNTKDMTVENMIKNILEKQEVAKKVNKILGIDDDPLGVMDWWYQPNAGLPDAERPWVQLMFGDDPKVVLELAEAIVESSG